ncbi:MAG: efflux RND transporter periplasmic adaptor subunit [Dysgonamonadaceae bacterium]|jgi:RND family efflux transporter MFP subunit|nr:efflux RND transporter periplasmic adaptor subunit [Dysgonamonadaceae bacterium]
METKTIRRLVPLFLGMGLLISCGQKKEENTQVTEKVKVTTTTALLMDVEKLSTYTANVKADVINQITPSTSGRIEKIYIEVGDRVQKGQLLVQMESHSLQQQTVQLANLQKDYQRYEELLKVGGIAQQQVDQIKTQIDVLSSAIENLEENTKLRSPIDGIITDRNYDNGDVYTAQPILTVQQLSPLKAVINVSESNFTNVKVGMTVDIKLDVYGDELFTGKVSLVYPTIDPTTHTFGVEVIINNSNMRVRPGMYARVTLNFGAGKSIVVPDLAVQKQAGSNDKYVFTVEDGVAKYQKVELGQRLAENYEILSGINPGDIVVTAGQTRLIDGTPVEVTNN